MNYYKSAEQVLSSVSILERSLMNLEKRKQRLIDGGLPADVGTISYDKPFTNSKFISDTLNELLSVSECQKCIAATKSEIDEIYSVIDQMPDEYQKIVRMWYIQKIPKEKIMDEMYIGSLATVYNLRNRAVAEFALLYYGSPALNSI